MSFYTRTSFEGGFTQILKTTYYYVNEKILLCCTASNCFSVTYLLEKSGKYFPCRVSSSQKALTFLSVASSAVVDRSTIEY
jgi:hypothetical protein